MGKAATNEMNAKKRRRKMPNRRGILSKEDEKIPLVNIIKRLKRKRAALSSEDEEVNKRRKIMEEKIPLADFYKKSRKRAKSIEEDDDISVIGDFYKMCRKRAKSEDISVIGDLSKKKRAISEDDGDITVMEVFKKIKMMQSPSLSVRTSKEEEVISMCSSSPREDDEEIISKRYTFPPSTDSDGSSGLDEEALSDEDSDEEKKLIRRSPVLIPCFSDHVHLDEIGISDSDLESESDQEESDEELVPETEFHEVDWDAKFVLRKRWRTITNPTVPRKVYFNHDETDDYVTNVLRDPEYPLVTFSKSAIEIYNAIQEADYEFVGLVKAYMRTACGFHYDIRFKARLHGQDAINFQASVCQAIRRKKTKVIPFFVEYVYPLPPTC